MIDFTGKSENMVSERDMIFSFNNEEINDYFSNMRNLKEEYQEKYDYITTLSMGMSNDYIEALKNGATIIRIGSKLFEQEVMLWDLKEN